MQAEAFACGIPLALVTILPLASKWRLPLSIVAPAALVIGILASVAVGLIYSYGADLGIAVLVVIELCFIGFLAVAGIALRFYRDPDRVPPEIDNVILAPADGEVIYVNNVERGSSLVSTKKGRSFELSEIMATDLLDNVVYLVGIDMNMLNIHVNRAPIGGKIVLLKRAGGKFISLRRPESETVNERVTTIIDNGDFKIGVVQIASRLVRRVVTYLREGEAVTVGQRIGMIKFGSQVDVAIPEIANLKIAAKPGDKVLAGVSVLARYGSPTGETERTVTR